MTVKKWLIYTTYKVHNKMRPADHTISIIVHTLYSYELHANAKRSKLVTALLLSSLFGRILQFRDVINWLLPLILQQQECATP